MVSEEELRLVALEEWRMTTALVLAQHVYFTFKLGVRRNRARLRQYLTTLNVVTLGATQQDANVLTSTTFVKQLTEHLTRRYKWS